MTKPPIQKGGGDPEALENREFGVRTILERFTSLKTSATVTQGAGNALRTINPPFCAKLAHQPLLPFLWADALCKAMK